MAISDLLAQVRDCRECDQHLPLGPRPVLRASAKARVVMIGQAPGTKVHNSGVPWNDASGDRLRDWLGMDRDTFYSTDRLAIIPMAFCYPGRASNGGDNPPRPECAPLWHGPLLEALPKLELTLLIGSYAQKYYLKKTAAKTMTETVRNWRNYLPGIVPTPPPSWRTTAWLRKNPWFEADVVPELRERLANALNKS
ncbi:MAG: uracil-DNA glycosylase family protein [Rhodospirillaceae bacterium]|nr:uracil-DNA glycosylase family protein [Rhodospirillaceae bacterium]